MKIVEINDYDDFLSLKERWSELLQRCNHTVFSTWEWLSTWWKHFGSTKKLILLLAEENDKIIGIAPLMYSVHTMFGLRRGKIEFIGTPDSDYNDFILADKENECIELFINHLNNFSENWNCIDLTDISENSKTLPHLNRITKTMKPLHKCPTALLPKSPELFLNNLKRKQRRELQRTLRRLEEDFKVEFVNYSGVSWSEEEMNRFFELHQKRWESKRFSGVFAGQRVRNFHLAVAKSFSQKGWLGLFLLRLSGVPAAALYGFKYMSKYYAYLSGFDPKYFSYSVGNLLFFRAIAECIKEGICEFDFMRGAEDYKDRWNTTARWNYQAVIAREGTLASVQHWLYNEYWRQGNRLKYFLKMK